MDQFIATSITCAACKIVETFVAPPEHIPSFAGEAFRHFTALGWRFYPTLNVWCCPIHEPALDDDPGAFLPGDAPALQG